MRSASGRFVIKTFIAETVCCGEDSPITLPTVWAVRDRFVMEAMFADTVCCGKNSTITLPTVWAVRDRFVMETVVVPHTIPVRNHPDTTG